MTAFDKAWTLLKELSPSARSMNNRALSQLRMNRFKALSPSRNPQLRPIGYPYHREVPFRQANRDDPNRELKRHQKTILDNARRSYSKSPNIRGPMETNYVQNLQDNITQQVEAGSSMNPDMEREQQSLMRPRNFRNRMGRERGRGMGRDSPNLGNWNRLETNYAQNLQGVNQ